MRRRSIITKFDSLYAGHIDMDNVGYAGTAVNDRHFLNEHLVTVFDKAQVMVQLMDRLGYDIFWTAEHRCGVLWSAGNPFREAPSAPSISWPSAALRAWWVVAQPKAARCTRSSWIGKRLRPVSGAT